MIRLLSCNRHYLLLVLVTISSCKSAIKEQSDKIYSRHLQRHVNLTIISTRIPDQKSDMNLLLLNAGNDLKQMDLKEIIDSLFSEKLIQPLVLVAIEGRENEEYGMANLSTTGKQGSKADKYNEFVINELYPFIKKKTAIRKFNSIAICGNSLKGISALDIAWQNADKIDKVGVFSANFNYKGTVGIKGETQNAILQEISSSRKRPKLSYWFYAAGTQNTFQEAEGKQVTLIDSTTMKQTKALIDIIDKKNTGSKADIKFVLGKSGSNDINSWRQYFADFLLWAFSK